MSVLGTYIGYQNPTDRFLAGIAGSTSYFISNYTATDFAVYFSFPKDYITTSMTLGLRQVFDGRSTDWFARVGIGLATQTATRDHGYVDPDPVRGNLFDIKSRYSFGYNVCVGLWYKDFEIAITTLYSKLEQHRLCTGLQIGYILR
jgi:hypothetical protein